MDKLDPLQQQGVIQCFEYNFELSWKTLQDYLSNEKGYSDIKGPRPVLQQAFQDQILSNGEEWFEMLQSRDLTSHLYDEKEILKIIEQIKKTYFSLFSEFKENMTKLEND